MKNYIIAFISKNRKFLFCGIAAFFILFIGVIAIIWVIRLSTDAPIFMNIAGQPIKLELIKLIGWGVSGLIAILSVIGLFQRAAALDKQNEITEKGHVQERFKVATEHLGGKSISVRIAAFNEFYHLAEIEQVWRKPIFDILCAHLRQTTKDKNYQKKEKELDTEEQKFIKPTEEVQNLLNILFKPDDKNNFIFVGRVADLEEVNLKGADLQEANLQKANLQNAKLQYTNLQNAKLQNAKLQHAKLLEADLQHANLQKTELQHAKLQYTKLQYANLLGANLLGADLENTDLCDTDLQYANLQYANLQVASMQDANLLGVNLHNADLQYANLQGANLQDADLQNARINPSTKMPDDWKKVVQIDNVGKTSVLVVNNQGKTIERL